MSQHVPLDERVTQEIRDRLTELKPLVAEYQRLQAALAALDSSNSSSRPRQPRSQDRRSDSRPRRGRMTRARSQEIDKQVLAILTKDPATKTSALALMTDTSAPSMNGRLGRLVKDGALKKRKRGGSVRYEVRQGKAA